MTRQPERRAARHWLAAVHPSGRRSWLSQGLAALAVSALGLAVAGSMSLTTSAQPRSSSVPIAAATASTASGASGSSGTVAGSVNGSVSAEKSGSTSTSVKQSAAAQAFLARDPGIDTSRSEQLRAALAKERAAQRAEDLAKSAELVTRAVQNEASKARQTTIDAGEAKIQANAVQLAWARQQRAIAARVAAGQAVTAVSTTDSTTTSTVTDPGSIPAGGTAVAPVPGAVIGTPFGAVGLWARYHTGLDFRAAYGTPIRAVLPGVVVFAGNTGDWAGNHVAIRHAGGVTTMSSHMSRIAVHAGQTVNAGDVIGYVGETGRAFGPHLHFELYPAGVQYGDIYKAIDPLPWLRAHGVQTH